MLSGTSVSSRSDSMLRNPSVSATLGPKTGQRGSVVRSIGAKTVRSTIASTQGPDPRRYCRQSPSRAAWSDAASVRKVPPQLADSGQVGALQVVNDGGKQTVLVRRESR